MSKRLLTGAENKPFLSPAPRPPFYPGRAHGLPYLPSFLRGPAPLVTRRTYPTVCRTEEWTASRTASRRSCFNGPCSMTKIVISNPWMIRAMKHSHPLSTSNLRERLCWTVGEWELEGGGRVGAGGRERSPTANMTTSRFCKLLWSTKPA